MEEQTTQDQIAQQGPLQSSSFNQPKSSKGGSKWVVIFILLLIVGGAGIFFFTNNANKPIATPTPTLNNNLTKKETVVPTPTKSPEPIKREGVTIEIQNGTGITGEAKLLQDKLKTLGYTDITVGNADSTDNTETTITFKKTLSQSVQDEIKKELESFYKTVNIKTSTSQKADILVVTGLRSSQTLKPQTSSTPSPKSSTASPTVKSSSTPSAVPTTLP